MPSLIDAIECIGHVYNQYNIKPDKDYIRVLDLLCSRYGWSIEYVENHIDFPLALALIKEVHKRPHFMWSNEDEPEVQQTGQNMPEMPTGTPQPNTVRGWQPKMPTSPIPDFSTVVKDEQKIVPVELHKMYQMSRTLGVQKQVLQSKLKEIRNNPEVLAIHKEIDKYVAVVHDRTKNDVEKNTAMREVFKLTHRLKDLGAVIKMRT